MKQKPEQQIVPVFIFQIKRPDSGSKKRVINSEDII